MTRHLYVHRSNRAEALAGALADLLRRPPRDPLRPERLVVQGRGMATWLSQELATRLGIFTNAEFLYPRNMVQHTYAEVLGRAELPLLGAQGQLALLFAVLEALSELAAQQGAQRASAASGGGAVSAGNAVSAGSAARDRSAAREAERAVEITSAPLTQRERAELAPLFSYLTGDLGGLRAYQLAERVARCYDQYLLFRPEMMRAFSEPADHPMSGGAAASAALRWQAALWRRLPAPIREGHIANLEPAFGERVAELTRTGEPHQLPERLCVFGLSSLPPLYLRTLTALSQLIEVHLFMLVPSREWFADRAPKRRPSLPQLAPLHLSGHPLLMSLGQLGADLQALVEEHATDYQEPLSLFEDAVPQGSAVFQGSAVPQGSGPGDAAPRLLHALQQSLLDLEVTSATTQVVLDDSIRIHSCHGPMREVEVLHDTLLDLLARDPTLQPQDIVVMASDIERYAPLFEAVFEEARDRAAETGKPQRARRFIPYRIADRAAATDAPVLEGLTRLFALAPSRRTASELMDLLGLAPVAKRFGVEQAELEQLSEWIDQSGIRWGQDAADRARHGQPALHQNTWRFGLERLLLGYSLPGRGERTFEGCLPHDEVEGHAAELAGKLAEFAETLSEVLDELAEPRSLADWHTTLSRSLGRLFDASGDHASEHLRAMAALDQLRTTAESTGFQRAVPARVMSALLERQLSDAHSAKSFLTGGVTLCALVPMRSIPRRVVCLLGLNEAAFPRRDELLPFDLQREAPRRGDRSRLLDDRYLFLEALLSARQHLHLSYTGQSIRDNSALPPSVVIDELLEHLERSHGETTKLTGGALRDQLVVKHPLQPFSPRYFEPGSRLFSYRAPLARGAAAAQRPREATRPLFSHALPERELPPELRLDELSHFLKDPGGYLLTQHLGASLPRERAELADREPLDLDPLARYGVGSELLRLLLRGHDAERGLELLRARGDVPPGALGAALYRDLAAEAEQLRQLFVGLTAGASPTPEALSVPLPARAGAPAVVLRGVVSHVYGSRAVRLEFVRPSAKHLLTSWVEHLARCAAAEHRVSSVVHQRAPVVGRPVTDVAVPSNPPSQPTHLSTELITRAAAYGDSAPRRHRFAPVTNAAERLAELHALYVMGSREPLPFFPDAAFAWVRAEARKDARADPVRSARAVLSTTFERAPYLTRLFPAGPSPEALLDTTGQLGFIELARRVMAPLAQHLTETQGAV